MLMMMKFFSPAAAAAPRFP
jgi:hypothetical protein